ncbi:hypothetical protein [Lysinibacillus sphaericus]|uniref:hypothetical protein n=1 Tax=Lysinibacillus sphaericus TaxID=1421 RepID=UPI001CC16B69|nr:hypothetical protein [Lysinibacillus sphaericus]
MSSFRHSDNSFRRLGSFRHSDNSFRHSEGSFRRFDNSFRRSIDSIRRPEILSITFIDLHKKEHHCRCPIVNI